MTKEIEIPEGYEARIEGNKVILEPKESEDEKIRKDLILFVDKYYGEETKKPILAWLERKKETVQSDTEKQYVCTLKSLISDFLYGKQEVDREYYQQICNWLEGRHIEQKPGEWDEEDKKFIKELCNLFVAIAKNHYVGCYYVPDLVRKLQSLRPQSHWIPNAEQMTILSDLLEKTTGKKHKILLGLYQQLKQL